MSPLVFSSAAQPERPAASFVIPLNQLLSERYMNDLQQGIARYLTPRERHILNATRIGIAGLGGLGSNVCMLLARTGIEHFFLADDDRVEASNLNRQHYFPKHIGLLKAEALRMLLTSLNPDIQAELWTERITAENVATLLPKADIWVEAFDGASDKAMLFHAALAAHVPLVCASGISGYGGPLLTKKNIAGVPIVGDFTRDCATNPPLAPRVVWAASMLADSVLEMLLPQT